VFGRTAMGEAVQEGLFCDRWRIRRGGRLAFAENFRLGGAIAQHLAETAVTNGQGAVATLLLVPGDEAAVTAVRAAAEGFRGEVAISTWNGIALARFAAPDGAPLRHDLVLVLAALGHGALPRIWLS
jgi:urease accessory protein